MFTTPRLEQGQLFPVLPTEHPDWQQLLDTVEIRLDPPGGEDPIRTLTRHAIGWVEQDTRYVRPWHDEPVAHSSRTPVFQRAGFIDAIVPLAKEQEYTVMDGGPLDRYARRLGHFTSMEERGLLETPNLIVFGGQCLRGAADDYATLARIARDLQGNVDKATDSWLKSELAKDPNDPNAWRRPFATERELGRIGLAMQYGKALQYQGTIARTNPEQLHETIPIPHDAADEFSVHGQRVVLLNAPAKIREHAGRKKDIDQARPTGRSCLYEWMLLDQPPTNSTVMLATSAPNTYRSWFDMVLRAAEAGRHDLQLTATGGAIAPNRTIGHVLVGLGDLFINFYNLKYEQGIDSPDVEPFKI